MHYTIAKLALDRGANFVSSSYIADDMRELHAEACESKLCLVNEVGLDHLMAHSLVHNYRNSAQFDLRNRLVFRSYCGGFLRQKQWLRYGQAGLIYRQSGCGKYSRWLDRTRSLRSPK